MKYFKRAAENYKVRGSKEIIKLEKTKLKFEVDVLRLKKKKLKLEVAKLKSDVRYRSSACKLVITM